MKTILKYMAYTSLFALVGLLSVRNWQQAKTEQREEEEQEGALAKVIEGRYEQEFLMTRDPDLNVIPRERLLTARRIADQKRAQMAQRDDAIPVYWNERGPNNVGGRTRGLIFDRNDATGHSVWAAGVAGGLWHTTNIDAGAPIWTLVDDFFANLAINTIAQDPSNSNIMYFGTGGEGTPNVGGTGFGNTDAVRGFGIWRSLDGGASWARLPFPDDAFFNVAKIVVTATGRVYAGTRDGVWSSNDNGQNWTQEPFPVNSGRAQDLEIAANGAVFAGINGNGIFRLQGGMWTQVAAGLPSSGFGRVELACASSSNRVYAMYENSSNRSCLGIFTTADGSMNNNWTACTNPDIAPAATPPALSNFAGKQAWYDLAMAVDPNNENRIFIGGIDLLVSGDAGTNWTQISQWYGNGFQLVHADHHAIVFRAGNSNEMLFGNDGGVWYSTNGNAATPTIQARNSGYNVTQFFGNAIHPTAGSNYMLAGAQDNGSQRFNSAGVGSTAEVTGGDGGFCFIDQDNGNIQITSYIRREFHLSTNGGASFTDNFFGNNSNALFITPAEYDNTANILYTSDSDDQLARVTDIGGANTLSIETISEFNGAKATAIAVSPTTANRLYVGTEDGDVVRIDNADQSGMVNVTALTSPVSGYIACIEIEPGDDNHLLAICSNYNRNSVLESTDGGITWVDLDNDLPDMPVRWALFNPFNHDQVLLATELGVWSTDDLDGVNTEWWPTSTFGLANVRVDMLQYRSSDHLVAAATHGRGMYTTDYFTLLNTCTPSLFVNGSIPSGLYMAEDFISSSGVINPGGKVILQAGNYVDMTDGFWAKQGSDFWALIRECNISPAPQPASWSPMERSFSESSGSAKNAFQSPGQLELTCTPNPTTYRLFIEANLPSEGVYSLYVRDLQGRMVERIAINDWHEAGKLKVEINAQNYAPGLYVLTLQSSNNTVTERFIVAR